MATSAQRTSPVFLIGLPVIAVALAAAALWVALVRAPAQALQAESLAMSRKIEGSGDPVKNKLADAFVDADGDLVADAPTDPAAQLDPPTLIFSFLPTSEPENESAIFAEFMAHLEKVTGKKVVYQSIEYPRNQFLGVRDGTLHITAFGTGGVPLAVNAAGFVPAAMTAGPDGNALYEMTIIASAASPIRTLDDLRGRELTLTSTDSNSGYKAPLLMLRESKGMRQPDDFLIRFSGGHEASIEGIKDGTYEAAAVASDVLARFVAAGRIAATDYREIYKEGPFPPAAFGYCHQLKPELAAKIREAFVSFDWTGTGLEKEFGGAGRVKFVPINFSHDWSKVRDIDDRWGTVHRLD